MKISSSNKKWITVLLHILIWMIVFLLPFLFRLNYDDRMKKDPDSNGFTYLQLLNAVQWIIVFYINVWFLSPLFINGKKILLYCLIITGIYTIIMIMHGLFFSLFIERSFRLFESVIFNLPPFVLTLAASMAYRMLSDKARTERLQQEKEEENLRSELSFLRSQISPHFVFNILNNITALARLKSDQLEPTVVKLSSLMRYMLYETNEEKVSLQTEIEYLQSYIDLQQQRFGNKVKINTTIGVPPESNDEIEPMLLIPFVENAFKHGTGLVQYPEINVLLSVRNNMLSFSVSNQYNEKALEVQDKTAGIGLTNVKRRLNLLYGKEHTLLISKKEGSFLVSLQLNLH